MSTLRNRGVGWTFMSTITIKTLSSKSVNTGQFPSDHQLVHGFGAFIGNHALQVQHVANGRVLYRDPSSAEDITAIAGDIQRHAHVVPFRQADLLRCHLTCVL